MPRMIQHPARYDPWRDLREHWPEVIVRIVPMRGQLLGWTSYPVIALRAGTTAAQRRCTLTHEIVHLERGITDCGQWADREERYVHEEVARRLISVDDLAWAIRHVGGTHDHGAIAALLEVDGETLQVRLGLITRAERRRIRSRGTDLWSVA